jgi:hypothetical protein
MNEEIFGACRPVLAGRAESLEMAFMPSAHTLKERWHNNSLSANFLGDYFANFFPRDITGHARRQNEVRAAVSFTANELLENAMKYCSSGASELVRLGLALAEDEIMLHLSHQAQPETARRLRAFIAEFLSMPAGDFMVLQMERAAASDTASGSSGLGFATMAADYGAELGWRIRATPGGLHAVATQVTLRF